MINTLFLYIRSKEQLVWMRISLSVLNQQKMHFHVFKLKI